MLDDVPLGARGPPAGGDGYYVAEADGGVWVVDEVLLGVREGLWGEVSVDSPTLDINWRELERGGRTLLTIEFHFLPPTRTLTVFCMRPADTTTLWSSRVTRVAAAVKGLSMVVRVGASSGGLGVGCRRQSASRRLETSSKRVEARCLKLMRGTIGICP